MCPKPFDVMKVARRLTVTHTVLSVALLVCNWFVLNERMHSKFFHLVVRNENNVRLNGALQSTSS